MPALLMLDNTKVTVEAWVFDPQAIPRSRRAAGCAARHSQGRIWQLTARTVVAGYKGRLIKSADQLIGLD